MQEGSEVGRGGSEVEVMEYIGVPVVLTTSLASQHYRNLQINEIIYPQISPDAKHPFVPT
jgi:hypothetical protein